MKVALVDSSKTSYSLFKNEYEKYLYDYKLFQKWLTDPEEFIPPLKALDTELKTSKDKNKRLTNILLKREQMYGLNSAGAPIYTSVLSGPEFVTMNKQGVLPKDHVTPEHGEYTHRLHWYILLWKMTGGFLRQPSAVCYNSPYLLLTKSTAAVHKPPKSGWPNPYGQKDAYETTVFSMWEALFDRRPFDGAYSITEDWLTCPEMFTAMLLPGDQEGGISAYQKLRQKKTLRNAAPNLAAEVTARYQKRAQELKPFNGNQSSWAKWYANKKAGQVAKRDDVDEKESVSELLVLLEESSSDTKYEFLKLKKKEKIETSTSVVVQKKR